ncbi:MAG: ribosome assembly RNA-binding protein YhbY [Zetaproteobacteria bacterium]|nr:ribosome assembly RNA-binding protein YhbY [Zetaproteobacteria bacterium]
MTLSSKEKKELKAQAHHLKPVIRMGQHGLTDGVIAETDSALTIHELIKVHIQSGERDERLGDAQNLASSTKAELVHSIGKTYILYRKNPTPKQA